MKKHKNLKYQKIGKILGSYDYWNYNCKGKVSGIDGDVCLDQTYSDSNSEIIAYQVSSESEKKKIVSIPKDINVSDVDMNIATTLLAKSDRRASRNRKRSQSRSWTLWICIIFFIRWQIFFSQKESMMC